jgi:UDP-N-acetylmuramate--alanine ligase
MENLRDSFEKFCNKVPFYGSVIINTDCENSRMVIPALNKRVISYGSQGDPDFKASRIRHSLFQSSFDLKVFGKNYGTLSLNVGGFHNVMNSLAAIAASYEIGLDIPVIQDGLKRFFLPERRFQVLFFDQTNLVIDDYAHHPTEITATVNTLRSGNFKRLIVVFQPHRFTRLKLLADKFASAFSHVDKLIITKLYAAGQKKIENVDSPWLMEKIRSGSDVDVEFMRSFDHIFNYLKTGLKNGDAVAFLSAGDLTRLAHKFAKWLETAGGGGEK